MAEINPPHFMANGCYSPLRDRRLLSAFVCVEGVKNAGGVGTDLRVGASQSAPLTVTIASGEGFVQGDDIANQGMYFILNEGHTPVTLSPPDPTDSRVDLIVARIHDGQYGGEPEDAFWELEVVAGVPSPVPVPPDLPNSALPLALVTIAPGTTMLQPSMIQDLRTSWEMCPDNIPGGDTGWVDVELLNDVQPRSASHFPQVRRIGDMVHFRGQMSNDNIPATTEAIDIMRLPEGFWPVVEARWMGFTTNRLPSQVYGGWVRSSDGTVRMQVTDGNPPTNHWCIIIQPWQAQL